MQNSKSQFKTSNFDIRERSYQFSLHIIKTLNRLPKSYIYQIIGRQLLRSATSIGANIIEAQAGSSKRDFKNFINHSLKSANETKYWLSLVKDSLRVDSGQIKLLLKEVDELCKILGASMLTLRGRR